MILHIANDEKVIDYAVNQFEEVFPGQNTFLINRKKEQRCKHVNTNLDYVKGKLFQYGFLYPDHLEIVPSFPENIAFLIHTLN